MGHRAFFVVKHNENRLIYSNKWGGQSVERDLLYGPDYSLAYLKHQKETDGWMNEVWCEGGAVVDCDRNLLTLFGGEDTFFDPYLREASLGLLRRSWQPWRVHWAHRRVRDLAAAAEVDESVVLVAAQKRKLGPPSCALENQKWCGSLLEIDGEKYTLAEPQESWLCLGEELFSALPASPKPATLPCGFPSSGVKITTHTKNLQYWNLRGGTRLEDRVGAAWPGYTVERCESLSISQTDDFLQAAGRRPPTLREKTTHLLAEIRAQDSGRDLDDVYTADWRIEHLDCLSLY